MPTTRLNRVKSIEHDKGCVEVWLYFLARGRFWLQCVELHS
jgi:hypothetical protein